MPNSQVFAPPVYVNGAVPAVTAPTVPGASVGLPSVPLLDVNGPVCFESSSGVGLGVGLPLRPGRVFPLAGSFRDLKSNSAGHWVSACSRAMYFGSAFLDASRHEALCSWRVRQAYRAGV